MPSTLPPEGLRHNKVSVLLGQRAHQRQVYPSSKPVFFAVDRQVSGLPSQSAQVQAPPPPLSSSVSLDLLLNLSVSQVWCLSSWDSCCIHLIGLLL